MILVGGTCLKVEDLPFADVMGYQIETEDSKLAIKLKTVANGVSCLAVYLSESILGNFNIPEDLEPKIITFRDDEHLIDLLDNGGKEDDDSDDASEDLDDSEVEFGTKQPSANVVVTSSDEDLVEEVDLSLQSHLLTIPNSSDDVDSLKQKLETATRTNEQLQANLQDRDSSIEEIYRLQEIQLLEMRDSYESRVDEANKVIEEMRQRVSQSEVPAEYKDFLKFATYAKNYKASLREGFSDEARAQLSKHKSKLFIFASGAGDSLHSMMKNVHHLIEGDRELVVADFSNDYFLLAKYRIQSKETSMLLDNASILIDQIVRPANVSKLAPTSFYNDIALLEVDWVSVLDRLMAYAQGRPVILLFNSINSFSVRFTVSRLATLGSLFIFVKSNPLVLATLTGDMAFIPSDRFRIVTLDYIDVVKSMLETIGSKHRVIAFKDAVNWSKLGVIK